MSSSASNPAAGESAQDRFRRVEEIFQRAADLPGHEREIRLGEWCAADDLLLEEVRSLLRSFDVQAPSSILQPRDRWLGQVLGHYRIDRLLGRGGMGAVYLATRVEGGFEQQVAIKLLGTRLTNRFHQERFLEERQILASLAHPNIAAMIDGGVSADGEPYLVMEYVDGLRLDSYVDQNRLSVPATLDLFLQVCDAVDYAHRRLVVHRDLKPGNILVDTAGRVKLLDFGTAKLLGNSVDTSSSPPTRAGMRAFTPEYASPEQMLGAPVTAATDVYSLGVILYRLLAGRPPYRLDTSAGSDFFAVLTATPIPPPSVAAGDSAEEAPSPESAFNRNDRRRALHGDLDAIILKAMRAEPGDRYREAASLADDLRNYLSGRPVLARPPAWTYSASKFVRRNRASVILSVALTLAAAAGLSVTLWQSRVARQESLRATRQFQNVRDLNHFLLIDFFDEVESLPGTTDVQKKLIAQSMGYLDRLQRQSPNDPQIQLDVIEALTKMGNLEGNPYSNNLSDPDNAIRTLTKAENLAAKLLERNPADPSAQKSYGLVERSLGEVEFGKGVAAPAIDHLQRAAPIMEKLAGRAGAPPDEICDAGSIFGVLGDIYSGSFIGKLEPAKAAAYFQKQVDLNRQALRTDPEFARAHRGIAIGMMKTGTVLQDTHTSQAILFFDSGLAEARQLDRKGASVPTERLMALLYNHLASALSSVDRFDEAAQQAREALRISQSFVTLDPSNNRALIDVANSWYHYGEALQIRFEKLGNQQDAADSVAAFNQSLASCRTVLRNQPDNPIWNGEVSDIQSRMSIVLRESGRTVEAERYWTVARELAIRLAEPDTALEANLERAAALFSSKSLRGQLWEVDRSLRYAERLNRLSQSANPSHLYLLGRACRLENRASEARSYLEKAATLAPPPGPGELKTRLRRDIEEELAAIAN